MSRRSLPAGEIGFPHARRGVAGLCRSYAPGHQMHYAHQGQALRSPSEHAREVVLDGLRLLVVRTSGEQLVWRHHDPARLADVLGLFPTSRILYPGHHALRLGPYWFNCAADDFVACDLPEGTDPTLLDA
jgi:hypothetical protein